MRCLVHFLLMFALGDRAYGFAHCELGIWLGDDDLRTTQVELADSPESRTLGLMGRRSVPAGTGMLFDFGEERPVSMWMKNTLVSLDMAFFRADGALVHVVRRTKPMSLQQIPAPVPIRYVLELQAGEGDSLVPGFGQRLDLLTIAACGAHSD